MKKVLSVLGVMFLMVGMIFAAPKLRAESILPEDTLEEIANEPTDEPTDEPIDWVALSGTIMAYVGGVSGLGAILAFALRFIKDRVLINKILKEVSELRKGDQLQKEGYNLLIAKLEEKEQSENSIINAFINVLSLTNLSTEEKRAIIDGLQSGVKQNIELVSAKIEEEAAQKKQKEGLIDSSTKSLLEKLAEE